MKKVVLYLLTISAVFAIDIQTQIDLCNNENDYHACGIVGALYYLQNTDKDELSLSYYMKGKIMMEKLCSVTDLDASAVTDLTACQSLGDNYEVGLPGYNQNIRIAMKYYNIVLDSERLSCNDGDESSCFKLGLDYSAKGLIYDPIKATKYFKKACKLGEENACEWESL